MVYSTVCALSPSPPMKSSISESKNPLFCTWLNEWYQESREQGSRGNNFEKNRTFVYKKAFESMIKYPDLIDSGLEAEKVTGIGPSIASRLETRLVKHAKDGKINYTPKVPEAPVAKEKEKKPRNVKVKNYVPVYRSGGFAILMALFEGSLFLIQVANNPIDHLTRQDLVSRGQLYTDSSFTVPSNGAAGYTAWSSMKTLCEKDLVIKHGNPARYTLTEEGKELCKKLKLVMDSKRDDVEINDVIHSQGSQDPPVITSQKSFKQDPPVMTSQKQKPSNLPYNIASKSKETSTTESHPFMYDYLDTLGNIVDYKSSAAIDFIRGSNSLFHVIRSHSIQQNHSFTGNIKNIKEIAGGFMTGLINEDEGLDKCLHVDGLFF